MKKTISLVLALVMCLSVCACGSDGSIPEKSDVITPAPVQNGDNTSIWSLKISTDEFGDITKDSVSFVAGLSQGTFSNTATSGSDLTVVTSFMKKPGYNHYIVVFDLKEYNDQSVTASEFDTITFKMKIDEEVIKGSLDATSTLTGNSYNRTLVFGAGEYTWGGDVLFNALYKGKDVRCIITINSSEYNFTLESDNFQSVCVENNFAPGAADLTVKEATKILLDDTGKSITYTGKWFSNNLDKLELMDTAQIEEFMEGYFLGISLTGVTPDPINGDYWYPHWTVYNYNISNASGQQIADYNFDDDLKSAYSNALAEGKDIVAYKGWRSYNGTQGTSWQVSAENNRFITTSNVNGNSTEYQCSRIADNLILIYTTRDDGSFGLARLLIKCNGYTEADIQDAVKYAVEEMLNQINN